MYDPYRDWTPKQVCMKAAQVTWTTMMVCKMFFAAQKMGIDIIYTLPTANDVKDIVRAKVNRIIRNNPILDQHIDSDSIEQKAIGPSIVYFRGTMTERAAISVSSDWNIFDELDRSDATIIEQYSSRQQHSKLQWESRFSNPSVPNHGAHKFWEKSDKKHWFIKCQRCHKDQFLDFPDSICPERRVYQCKHCKTELSREARRVGQWVAKHPGREVSGYWVNLMMTVWTPATKILENYEQKPAAIFDNYVLGLPHYGTGNVVMRDDIVKNVTDEKNTQKSRPIMGLDTGTTLYYVMGNDEGVFYRNRAKNYDEIERLLRANEDLIIFADAHGDLIKIRELRERYPNRIFLCYYVPDKKRMEMVSFKEKDDFGVVHIDRNRMIQHVIDEFKLSRIKLFGSVQDWEPLIEHYGNIFRAVHENKRLSVDEHRWERSGPDHYVHAMNYLRAGLSRFGGSDFETFGGMPQVGLENKVPEDFNELLKLSQQKKYDWRDV